MTAKRPWNRIDSPVYSLATNSSGGVANMNICSYVTAISMKPKIYSVSVYKGSKTLQNIEGGSQIVLQLLAEGQIAIVRRLGFKSGHDGDKLKRLDTTRYHLSTCLTDALAWVLLVPIEHFDSGDHITYMCRVEHWQNQTDGEPLMLGDLRSANIIRA